MKFNKSAIQFYIALAAVTLAIVCLIMGKSKVLEVLLLINLLTLFVIEYVLPRFVMINPFFHGFFKFILVASGAGLAFYLCVIDAIRYFKGV